MEAKASKRFSKHKRSKLSVLKREFTTIICLMGMVFYEMLTNMNSQLFKDALKDILRIIKTSNLFLMSVSALCVVITIKLIPYDFTNQIIPMTTIFYREVFFPFFCVIILTGRAGLYNTASIYQLNEMMVSLNQDEKLVIREMGHLVISGVVGIISNYILMNFYYYVGLELYSLLSTDSTIRWAVIYPGSFFDLSNFITTIKLVILSIGINIISIYFGLKPKKIADLVTSSVTYQVNFSVIMVAILLFI